MLRPLVIVEWLLLLQAVFSRVVIVILLKMEPLLIFCVEVDGIRTCDLLIASQLHYPHSHLGYAK